MLQCKSDSDVAAALAAWTGFPEVDLVQEFQRIKVSRTASAFFGSPRGRSIAPSAPAGAAPAKARPQLQTGVSTPQVGPKRRIEDVNPQAGIRTDMTTSESDLGPSMSSKRLHVDVHRSTGEGSGPQSPIASEARSTKPAADLQSKSHDAFNVLLSGAKAAQRASASAAAASPAAKKAVTAGEMPDTQLLVACFTVSRRWAYLQVVIVPIVTVMTLMWERVVAVAWAWM